MMKLKYIYCNESTILSNDVAIVSLDLETLQDKDLGILRYVTHGYYVQGKPCVT